METRKYKTTIKCSGCVAKVTPALNSMENIQSWNVDLTNPDKILEVSTTEETDEKVISKLQELGFEAKPVD